jgi:Fe-S cluster assembly scaffold protein SufB
MIVYLEEGATLYFSQNAYAGHVNNTWVYLKRNAEYELRSTYYVKGHQTYLFNGVYHLEGSTSALLQIQGAARDQAHVLNDGMVRIEKDTGNCKGYQSINGLLLDRTSQISNEPMLEIYNSDVECSHGASVTQIEDQLLYYMQSRGLTKEEVIDLVVEGYFAWSWESLDATTLEFMKGYREQLMLQH